MWLSGLIVGVSQNESDTSNFQMLKVITDPFTDAIILVHSVKMYHWHWLLIFWF